MDIFTKEGELRVEMNYEDLIQVGKEDSLKKKIDELIEDEMRDKALRETLIIERDNLTKKKRRNIS